MAERRPNQGGANLFCVPHLRLHCTVCHPELDQGASQEVVEIAGRFGETINLRQQFRTSRSTSLQQRTSADMNYEGVVSGAASALIDNLTSIPAARMASSSTLPVGVFADRTSHHNSNRRNVTSAGTSAQTPGSNGQNYGLVISPSGVAGEGGVDRGAASNYTDLPPLNALCGDNSLTLSQCHGARPRTRGVQRSHTSPDSLFVISRPTNLSTTSSPTSPTTSTSAANQERGKSRAKSVRKSFDSFVKATRRRFNRKSRHLVNEMSNGLSPKETRDDSEVAAGVLPLRPTAVEPPSTHRLNQGNIHFIPFVIPVMNMGPSEPARPESDEFDDIATSMPHIRAHTTVDYVHCLVPDLSKVTNCGFYWGVMDRYEAEALLDNKPEGTFLLRDSSQDDFIFSVSFRRYGRSLHARVEQWNQKFSFDAHDSGVFKADSITTLIEHYKDPQTCMFFEPMLTRALNRPQAFSLLHLARGVVCDNTNYDSIDNLSIPKNLQEYLRYYHYKQKVRVRTHSNARESHQPRVRV